MAASKSANPEESKSSSPLYLQVAQALRDDIIKGVYPVGAQLPTEDNLCDQFSVSRYTVREALRLLRNDGLVASRKRAGTIVIPPKAKSSDIHQSMSINDLVEFANDTRLTIESIATLPLDKKLADRTALPEGEEWLVIVGTRDSEKDGTPKCCIEYYINRDFAAVGRLMQRKTGPIFSLIEDLFGQTIVEVQQQISATLLSAAQAKKLRLATGSAALVVRRAYKTGDGRIAQVTINTYPADGFKYTVTLQRGKE